MPRKTNELSQHTKTKVGLHGERGDKLNMFRGKMLMKGKELTSDEKAIHLLMDEGFKRHKIF